MTENKLKIVSAAISDKGLSKKRPQNEDSFLELNARGLFVVADGVGGAQAGDVASQMAVEILGEAFANLSAGGDAEEMMRVAIERANQSIFQMSHDLTELSTMATTVVALHVAGNIATIGHVGDSRLYRLDAQGNLLRETQDHSVVEEEVRAGRMTEAQASNHPSRNIISRALGADYAVAVDMKTIMFEPNTTFLLCSDGITRHIDDREIRELLVFNEPADIVQRMKEICYERGAEDNLTAVVARIYGAADEIFVDEKAKAASDFEEPTVATPRAATATTIAVSKTAPLGKPAEDFPTAELELPASRTITNSTVVQSQTIPLVAEQAAPLKIDETNNQTKIETESVKVPIAEPAIQTNRKAAMIVETDRREIVERAPETHRVAETEDTGSGGKLGKILSTLLCFILGGLAGAGLYYVFERNNRQPEAPVLVQQSDNIDLTSFERIRRDVDRDPQQFLAANKTAPVDAEDFYLLGRANLYSGRFSEAKQMFAQAKDRLAQSGAVNGKVLANDIESGLIITDVPLAQDEFKKRLNLNRAGADSNSAIQNTNAQ